MRILVAEDDKVSRMVLCRALHHLGDYQLDEAEDGAEAWRLFQMHRHAIVISDWMMPEVDGLELCSRIRSLEAKEYSYLIMLTAKTQREDRMRALQSGADDFLAKPLEPAELAARLHVANRIHEMQRTMRRQADDLVRAKTTLEHINRRISEMFKGLPIPCITINDQALVMEWNDSAAELFEAEHFEVWEKPIWATLVDEMHQEHAVELAFKALEKDHLDAFEWSVPMKHGKRRDLLIRSFQLKAAGNEVVGAAITFFDITEQRALEQQIEMKLIEANDLNAQLELKNYELEDVSSQLEYLASTDGLTGLQNYRVFRERLRELFAEAKEGGKNVAMVLMDVDHFKQYNDSFGHPAGDDVLRTVARVLQAHASDGQFAARYGGEEFVLLLQGLDPHEAVMRANQVRAAIEQQPWTLRSVTASMGVAAFSDGYEDDQAMILAADAAMYRSKEGGRNRVSYSQVQPKEAAA